MPRETITFGQFKAQLAALSMPDDAVVWVRSIAMIEGDEDELQSSVTGVGAAAGCVCIDADGRSDEEIADEEHEDDDNGTDD